MSSLLGGMLGAGAGMYLYDYALALVRADHFDEAQNEAERAVRADSSLIEPHELLAGLHARKNELSQAAREYLAALALKPDLARAHFQLAKVLAAQGDKEGAATHFREAANGTDSAISRQAEHQLIAANAKNRRAPGPNRHRVKIKFSF